MSPKLKKLIIALVVFLLVGVVALIGVTMLGDISTTTVYDLRLVDAQTKKELFDKEVYLTALSKNNFDVKVDSDTSSMLNYVVLSSDPTVASVAYNKETYKITYHKAGKATISVQTAETSAVKDSFVLTVKENIASEFAFVDDEGNLNQENEITIYADDRDYMFKFQAQRGTISENINVSQIVVVDDYNRDVFEDIYVDDANSQLVINAKQNEESIVEYITLQSKYKDALGNEITVSTFDVCINIKGNYISDIQLMLNEEPNFEASGNIYGSGAIQEGENKVNIVRLSKTINTVYAKLRVVYTNGEYFDVTSDPSALPETTLGVTATEKVSLGNYFKIFIPDGFNGGEITVTFSYKVDNKISLKFIYLGEEDSVDYQKFVNEGLYIKEGDYFKYNYWDKRYMRDDAITDKDGNIVGFVNGNPIIEEPQEG